MSSLALRTTQLLAENLTDEGRVAEKPVQLPVSVQNLGNTVVGREVAAPTELPAPVEVTLEQTQAAEQPKA